MKAAAVWTWARQEEPEGEFTKYWLGTYTQLVKIHVFPKLMSSTRVVSIAHWSMTPYWWKSFGVKAKPSYICNHFIEWKISPNITLPLPCWHYKIFPCFLKLLPSLTPTAWGKFYSKQASMLLDWTTNTMLSSRKYFFLPFHMKSV